MERILHLLVIFNLSISLPLSLSLSVSLSFSFCVHFPLDVFGCAQQCILKNFVSHLFISFFFHSRISPAEMSEISHSIGVCLCVRVCGRRRDSARHSHLILQELRTGNIKLNVIIVIYVINIDLLLPCCVSFNKFSAGEEISMYAP